MTEITEFERELAALINRHSMENGWHGPDFVLAAFAVRCLDAFAAAANYDPWSPPSIVAAPAAPAGGAQNAPTAEQIRAAHFDCAGRGCVECDQDLRDAAARGVSQ